MQRDAKTGQFLPHDPVVKILRRLDMASRIADRALAAWEAQAPGWRRQCVCARRRVAAALAALEAWEATNHG